MTSQINPNNIDGNYPVAGVPNNTQGMRDNFTNTKTNFQYAYDEITELQSKVVLKQALTGTTLDNNMNGSVLYNATLKDIGYSYVPVAATSGSVELDYSAGGYQQITPTGSISLSFTNWPASGIAGSLRVGINVTNLAYTVTLPAAVSVGVPDIAGINPGTPGVSNTITFGRTGNYAFEFATVDAGTTIWVFDQSRPADTLYSTLNIANTTPSTSDTTGALKVAGGAGIAGNVNIGGNLTITGTTAHIGNISLTGSGNIIGNITVTGSGGVSLIDGGTVGYGVGAGGTVSQGSSSGKSTPVTLNKPSGQITMASGVLSGGANATFTLTNSAITNTDVMIINHISGGTLTAYQFFPICNSGTANITIVNRTAGNLNEQPVIRFAVIKGSTT